MARHSSSTTSQVRAAVSDASKCTDRHAPGLSPTRFKARRLCDPSLEALRLSGHRRQDDRLVEHSAASYGAAQEPPHGAIAERR